MPYSATNWVEGVTTLGPTNMNKIETELARLKVNADLDPAAAIAYSKLALAGSVVNADISAAAAIAASKLAAYPSDGTKLLKGDGTWGPTYTAYTPTWTATGTAPAIGNAAVVGSYVQVGKLVHTYGSITFGSTSTFGTGSYRFALPVSPSANALAAIHCGTCLVFDNSAGVEGIARVGLVSATVFQLALGTTYLGTTGVIAQTVPWTWAVSDVIAWNMTYEAA